MLNVVVIPGELARPVDKNMCCQVPVSASGLGLSLTAGSNR